MGKKKIRVLSCEVDCWLSMTPASSSSRFFLYILPAAIILWLCGFFTSPRPAVPSPPGTPQKADLGSLFPIRQTPHPTTALLAQLPPLPARLGSVARFRSPATWCRANPFLASWAPSDFEAAAAALAAWRGSIVRLTHEETWRAHPGGGVPATHAPFASLPRVINTTGCKRYGAGEGGKWVCDAAILQDGCVVYSLGSDGDFSFETAMLAASPCTTHTLDCTLSNARTPVNLPPRSAFHPLCLGDDDSATSRFRSLRSIMGQLGHASVDVLKVDIEGFEYRLVEGLFRTFLEEGDVAKLPWQLLMEQHYLTHTEVAWGKGKDPGLSSGDMAVLWMNLADMGYVLVHREDQGACGFCTELTALRVFC